MWEKIFDELSSSPSMDAVSYKKLAKVFISEVLSAEVSDLLEHVEKYNALCEDIRTLMHVPYIFHTKKFGLLLRDPIEHIERVLASKVSSLFSKNVSRERFYTISNLTVKKCIDTNMRIMFQNFVALSILYNLHSYSPEIVDPDNGWLHLSRTGFQHNGAIPPNYVVRVNDIFLSFFLEAPRPIHWSKRIKHGSKLPLHAAPRPDIMVYRGWIKDILNGSSSLIIPPDFLIECKEISGWWSSVRPSKGIKHLTDGEIENVTATKVLETYTDLYHPKKIILVSKVKVPRGVKYKLSLRGVDMIDETDFNSFNIKPLSDLLLN